MSDKEKKSKKSNKKKGEFMIVVNIRLDKTSDKEREREVMNTIQVEQFLSAPTVISVLFL
jgi:hypothetical protein